MSPTIYFSLTQIRWKPGQWARTFEERWSGGSSIALIIKVVCALRETLKLTGLFYRDYQKSAIATYFAQHDPPYPYYTFNGIDLFHKGSSIGANGGIYNRQGRGQPDVSANGANLLAYNNLTLFHFYGTSLSSPIFASILTLINGERSQAGKGPVGFVHPVFYEHPEIFHDITNGKHLWYSHNVEVHVTHYQ